MGKPTRPLSPALLAGQRRLLALREEQRTKWADASVSAAVPSPDFSADRLPTHLGWGSPAVTAVLRKSESTGGRGSKGADVPPRQPAPLQTRQLTNSPPHKPAASQTCKLYPNVALGMLRQEQAAAGRIWLLLRHIDNVGRGWVSFEETREKLTQKKSVLRVCGGRQLRNLLNQGEGVFWERRNGRIWLRSVAKTAAALDVWQLRGQPVAIPLKTLLRGIGQVRAHLYASFHSGRNSADKKPSPIARDTLAAISHINKRTQRRYEKRARVSKKHNFAVGPQINKINEEKTAWQHGRAAFHLTDQDGRHGRKGITYLAWQLPNNYTGPHAKLPRGRQKRINRELADLFMKGMTGNSEEMVDVNWRQKQYFANGRAAGKAYQRAANTIYWQNNQAYTHFQLWYVLKD